MTRISKIQTTNIVCPTTKKMFIKIFTSDMWPSLVGNPGDLLSKTTVELF